MPDKQQVCILDYEPVQIIQSRQKDIPLLTSRPTAVRVYVEPRGLRNSTYVSGVLEVQRTGGETYLINSTGHILLNDRNHPPLQSQRRSEQESLMFVLDAEFASQDDLSVRLCSLRGLQGQDPGIEIVEHEPVRIEFEIGPKLRVRVVGIPIRNPDTEQVYFPQRKHFQSIKSFIERSFPISNLEWSELHLQQFISGLEPPFQNGNNSCQPNYVWQHKHDIACAFLMALRAAEIDLGDVDPRTHYYGLVSSPRGDFFAGSASDVQDGFRPDLVSAGPALTDGSYGGHEIAHTLGGLHPGYPLAVGDECPQNVEDKEFPKENHGRLSNPTDEHHGFDFADVSGRPRVLDYSRWYDLMSWASPKIWTSDYRFCKLLERIKLEDSGSMPRRPSSAQVCIVGRYGLKPNQPALKNEIVYVFKIKDRSMAQSTKKTRVAVRGLNRAENELFKVYVESKRAEAADLHKDSGAFNVTAEDHDDLHKLQLLVDEQPAGDPYLINGSIRSGTFSSVEEWLNAHSHVQGPHISGML